MKKRTLAFLLVLCMLVSILPAAAFAEEMEAPELEASEYLAPEAEECLPGAGAPDEAEAEVWEETSEEDFLDAEYEENLYTEEEPEQENNIDAEYEADLDTEEALEEFAEEAEDVELAASASILSNPRVVSDSSMDAKQKATWDCIWFGSYPQAEVVSSKSMITAAIGEAYLNSNDYIVDATLYSQLKNATGWNSNNEITINGSKYRRMKKSDAAFAPALSGFYKWSNSTTYHYFKYQPIKWRVLSTNGSTALLLADNCLDDSHWNSSAEIKVNWGTSQIRSWLNGYSASANTARTDYTANNFCGTAFTSAERESIVNSTVKNNVTGSLTDGSGTSTTDRIFLLSFAEALNTTYGFSSDYLTNDNARRARASTYARARGTSWSTSSSSSGNTDWWLRSAGDSSRYPRCEVDSMGMAFRYYKDTYYDRECGARPALKIKLSSSSWSYAGTVCSDGTAAEQQPTCAVHHYSNTVKKPTCTEKGYTTHICSQCGYSYTDAETAALGHSFTNYIYNNDAKICVNGTETAACDHGCGFTNTRTKTGSALPDPNPKNPFLDVPPDKYYYAPVLWAVENKITSGTSDTTFEPEKVCSRAQVVTFLWRAAGRPEPTTKVNPFTDVKKGMYYYKAVLWAVENKITSGTTKTTFSPDASCTRAQVVAFLWRVAGRPNPTTTANPFTDVKEDLYYSKAVLWAVEKKITSGTSKTTFSPDQICTRGQIVTFLYLYKK